MDRVEGRWFYTSRANHNLLDNFCTPDPRCCVCEAIWRHLEIPMLRGEGGTNRGEFGEKRLCIGQFQDKGLAAQHSHGTTPVEI